MYIRTQKGQVRLYCETNSFFLYLLSRISPVVRIHTGASERSRGLMQRASRICRNAACSARTRGRVDGIYPKRWDRIGRSLARERGSPRGFGPPEAEIKTGTNHPLLWSSMALGAHRRLSSFSSFNSGRKNREKERERERENARHPRMVTMRRSPDYEEICAFGETIQPLQFPLVLFFLRRRPPPLPTLFLLYNPSES